jgi:hypothetical protein
VAVVLAFWAQWPVQGRLFYTSLILLTGAANVATVPNAFRLRLGVVLVVALTLSGLVLLILTWTQ